MHADVRLSGSIMPRNVNFGTNCSKYSPSSFSFLTPWQRRHDTFRIGDLVGIKFGHDFSEEKGYCSPRRWSNSDCQSFSSWSSHFVPECTGFRPQFLKLSQWCCWRIKSCAVLCCVHWCRQYGTVLGRLHPEDIGATVLRNVSNCSSVETAKHGTRFGSLLNHLCHIVIFLLWPVSVFWRILQNIISRLLERLNLTSKNTCEILSYSSYITWTRQK